MGNANDTKKQFADITAEQYKAATVTSVHGGSTWITSPDFPNASLVAEAIPANIYQFFAEHPGLTLHVEIVRVPKPRTPISIDSTELHTWFERDRSHVELRSKLWEAIEDGFLPSSAFILGRLHDESALHDAAYKYAESHGMLPDAPKHYIAMSGSHGCLPDHCEVYETYADAIQDLVDLFELGRTRKVRLKRDSYLELKPNPVELNMGQDFGAEYCEITECDCDNPAQHSDSL